MSEDGILQVVVNPWVIEHGGLLAVKERGTGGGGGGDAECWDRYQNGQLPSVGESSG